jgi:hypothetical protein
LRLWLEGAPTCGSSATVLIRRYGAFASAVHCAVDLLELDSRDKRKGLLACSRPVFGWAAADIEQAAKNIPLSRPHARESQLLPFELGIHRLSLLRQSKRLQTCGLFANGDSLSFIFGHRISRSPRALLLSETLFCPLPGLI